MQKIGSLQHGLAHLLGDSLPADPAATGKDSFRNAVAGALNQLGRPLRCEVLLGPL
jgi:hypothetical protein